MEKQIFIAISTLTCDPDLQVRVRLSKEAISQFAERMKTEADLKAFEAVIVYFDGTNYWLADGHHRVEAAKKSGHSNVWAIVRNGERKEALWTAITENSKHGVNLTRADRRRSIELIIEQWPEKSTTLIAEATKSSQSTVDRIKRQLTQMGKLKQPHKTIGKDGRVRSASQKKNSTGTPTVTTPTTKATAKKESSTQPALFEAVDDDNPVEQSSKTVSVSLGPKVNETFNCGVIFEPDPDDDYYDWITDEERAELYEMRKTCPNKLVPQIHNYTIQNIPEHKPDQLINCLCSLFKPPYREKVAFALLRRMREMDTDRERAQNVVTTLYHEFQKR